MSALADDRVAKFFNATFVCTYLKVGTFQIINGQKVGGNVASYFCLADGSVMHAIAGPVDANKLLMEGRWACDVRKSALTLGAQLGKGNFDMARYQSQVKHSHQERFHVDQAPLVRNWQVLVDQPLPETMPQLTSKQAQVHWLLASRPLAKLETIYPVVWTQILNEKLSALPVAQR